MMAMGCGGMMMWREVIDVAKYGECGMVYFRLMPHNIVISLSMLCFLLAP